MQKSKQQDEYPNSYAAICRDLRNAFLDVKEAVWNALPSWVRRIHGKYCKPPVFRDKSD